MGRSWSLAISKLTSRACFSWVSSAGSLNSVSSAPVGSRWRKLAITRKATIALGSTTRITACLVQFVQTLKEHLRYSPSFWPKVFLHPIHLQLTEHPTPPLIHKNKMHIRQLTSGGKLWFSRLALKWWRIHKRTVPDSIHNTFLSSLIFYNCIPSYVWRKLEYRLFLPAQYETAVHMIKRSWIFPKNLFLEIFSITQPHNPNLTHKFWQENDGQGHSSLK